VLSSASLMPAIYSMSFMQSNISFSQTSNSMLQISAKAKLLWLLTVIAPQLRLNSPFVIVACCSHCL
jgi:hypothetical protein